MLRAKLIAGDSLHQYRRVECFRPRIVTVVYKPQWQRSWLETELSFKSVGCERRVYDFYNKKGNTLYYREIQDE
jgi:hypothetical protein